MRNARAPREKPADRVEATFDVPFELSYPARLRLRTEPGPSGNASWDWAYWSGVTVEQAR
jgi:hypothetical protein